MGADTGGITAANMRAFDGVPDWEYRAIISTLNFLNYDRDMAWSVENVKTFWYWADVIHLHHSMVAADRLTKGWKGFRLPRRPYVVEFHGTGFRQDARRHLNDMRRHGALGIVSTLDLYLLAPDQVEWIPCPVNIERMQEIRNDGRTSDGDADPASSDSRRIGADHATGQGRREASSGTSLAQPPMG